MNKPSMLDKVTDIPDIVIYKDKHGQIKLKVNLSDDTVWLSQKQLADLFDKNVRTISEHISNVFKEGELEEGAVIRDFRITAADGKEYNTKHYNLDVIISIGYRVHSSRGTEFRQWASRVLKAHLIKGYTIKETRIAEQGLEEIRQSIGLLEKTLRQNELISDIGAETVHLIMSYAKTWKVLLAYDEDKLELPEASKSNIVSLKYEEAVDAISVLKTDLMGKKEASVLFGNERDHGLEGILGSIEQTFEGELLYKSGEERAAHLLYFVIKDHPFSDGNKRIGCLMFLIYLSRQNIAIKINNNGLVALALLIAESDPDQKQLITGLIVNLLNE